MRKLAAAAVVGSLVALAWTAAAQAGTYDVYACRLPDGRAAPAGGWSTTGLVAGDYRVSAGCPGGSLTVAVPAASSTHLRPNTIGWRFDAVDDTTLVAYDVTRRVAVTRGASSAFNYEAFLDEIDYAQTGLYDHCWSASGCFSRPASLPLAKSGLSAHSLILFTDCTSGQPDDCEGAMTASIAVDRARMTLADVIPPVFNAPPSGSLLDTSAPLTGIRTVSFSAADRGGGLYRAVLEVDGVPVLAQPIDTDGGACVAPFTRPLPCKLAATGSLSFDTGAVPNGAHKLRLLVYDATDSNVAAWGPVDVTTANGPGQCATGSAVAGSVGVRFASKRGRSITLRYGRGRTIRGTVTDTAGHPVPGARVSLLSRVRRTAARTREGRTPLVAGADGRFAYKIPKGPSRLLRFGWRASPASSLLTCSAQLRVNVRAPVSLSASPHAVGAGGRVRLSGRLRGGYLPARGRVLDLQAFDRGRWRVFNSVRTRGNGRFATSYRFTSGARGSFPIRVRVRPSSDYPYTLSYSRSVRVRVV
jgi:hypothetical protein